MLFRNSFLPVFTLCPTVCLSSFFGNEKDDESGRFEISSNREIIPGRDVQPVSVFETPQLSFIFVFSRGTCRRNGNRIICFDPRFRRYYTFDQIDEYTLIATRHTALFTKGDTLKMSSRRNGDFDETMSWAGNKRHGIWTRNYPSRRIFNSSVVSMSIF